MGILWAIWGEYASHFSFSSCYLNFSELRQRTTAFIWSQFELLIKSQRWNCEGHAAPRLWLKSIWLHEAFQLFHYSRIITRLHTQTHAVLTYTNQKVQEYSKYPDVPHTSRPAAPINHWDTYIASKVPQRARILTPWKHRSDKQGLNIKMNRGFCNFNDACGMRNRITVMR